MPGVEVGFTTLIEGEGDLVVGKGPVCTGVTAILPHGHTAELPSVWAALFSLNGNGEMTGSHWINEAGYFTGPICITNTHGIGAVHEASTRWMLKQYMAPPSANMPGRCRWWRKPAISISTT